MSFSRTAARSPHFWLPNAAALNGFWSNDTGGYYDSVFKGDQIRKTALYLSAAGPEDIRAFSNDVQTLREHIRINANKPATEQQRLKERQEIKDKYDGMRDRLRAAPHYIPIAPRRVHGSLLARLLGSQREIEASVATCLTQDEDTDIRLIEKLLGLAPWPEDSSPPTWNNLEIDNISYPYFFDIVLEELLIRYFSLLAIANPAIKTPSAKFLRDARIRYLRASMNMHGKLEERFLYERADKIHNAISRLAIADPLRFTTPLGTAYLLNIVRGVLPTPASVFEAGATGEASPQEIIGIVLKEALKKALHRKGDKIGPDARIVPLITTMANPGENHDDWFGLFEESDARKLVLIGSLMPRLECDISRSLQKHPALLAAGLRFVSASKNGTANDEAAMVSQTMEQALWTVYGQLDQGTRKSLEENLKVPPQTTGAGSQAISPLSVEPSG